MKAPHKTHLEFYIQNKISPVHYSKVNIKEHFEQRASLYRGLGLLPLSISGSRVLEVAVGSGQNSLYLASLFPESLTLVEPNPTGISEIQNLYDTTKVLHTPPRLVESTLQAYRPDHKFDIVICENWLGRATTERILLRKLAGFLSKNGVLVVTTQPPIGLLANMIRRALMVKFCDNHLPFEQRTEIGVAMFASHLSNMKAMTRSAKDWVQDNMLNPAYYDLYLTIPDVINEVGDLVTALGTNPRMSLDWRWFKSLHGDGMAFSEHLVKEYQAGLHNLFDYELEFNQVNPILNLEIESLCVDFIESVRTYEDAVSMGVGGANSLVNSTNILLKILERVKNFPEQVQNGIEIGLKLLLSTDLNHTAVATQSPFSRLFGRENIYLSMIADKDRS
jgi:2-polyprenyl-3-methyl-5-hydroxy-6-metoxy-1,4-benzoquinol methylase